MNRQPEGYGKQRVPHPASMSWFFIRNLSFGTKPIGAGFNPVFRGRTDNAGPGLQDSR